jgi:hypothetical protein
MPLFRFPLAFGEKFLKIREGFFWQGGHSVRKYHLVKWKILCRPKDREGLGIKNLDKMNICKWWRKLENNDGLWQDNVHAKYAHKKPIALV